jgi:acetylornithine deacetylase/succinyl-diaminopimelate desuccinylase-like protein
MDGRILPGQTAEGFIREIQDIAGNDLELEIVRNDPGPVHTDMGLFPLLKGILEELHPGSHPIPILLAGMTDARYFSKLGIQTYGFTPLRLPPSFPYGALIHAVDERVPATALEFGVTALERLILSFG